MRKRSMMMSEMSYDAQVALRVSTPYLIIVKINIEVKRLYIDASIITLL